MDKLMKKCIRELGINKNIDENLCKYAEMSMYYNGSMAYLKMSMEYYMFYETVSEELNPYISSIKDTLDAFNNIIECFFENHPDKEECKKLLDELLDIRKEVISKMQVLTAYVDCFVLYEYVFNRLQYRFDKMDIMPEDDKFIETVVNFIFGTKDNVTINENIRFIIGQLPMRMLRSKYFDIIRESVSVYKGNDIESLESFEYMFRTNAMLYKNKNMDIYFTEFKQVLDELRNLDYDNISRDLYYTYSEKNKTASKKIADISDLYMQLGKLINSVYIIILESLYKEDTDNSASDALNTTIIIRGINSLFTGKENNVWQSATEAFNSDKDKLSWLSGFFDKIMGKQEDIRETIDALDAVLDETINVQCDNIKKLGLIEKFNALGQMSLLDSSSTFAELDKGTQDTKVTAKMADETAAKLISEVKELFKGSSRMFRRAVMANTIDKMPVFFDNMQDVANYISSSLVQCDDEAEKYASKEIIMDAVKQ